MLRLVLDNGRTFSEALTAEARNLETLSVRDRGFARLMVLTCLRRLGQLDDAVGRCLARPLDRRANRIRPHLRLGAAQLLFLDTAPHAAINEAVNGAHRLPQYKALLNAVLRRLSRDREAILKAQDAARLNCPGWLWQAWSAVLGESDCRAAVEAMLREPPLDLSCPGDPEKWAGLLQAETLDGGTLRLQSAGPVAQLPGYADGAWWVQDVAAALPARLLGDVRGQRVLDLCAAPGGKTAQLIAAGARVTALDRSPRRLTRLSDNLARLGFEAEVIEADATAWRPEAPFDAVMLDAPCSATGTIRRRPDVWHLRQAKDIDELVRVQDHLLDNLANLLRPGGRAVYCVCSLLAEEGPARITAFLERRPDFVRLPVAPTELPDRTRSITAEGDVRTLPQHISGGMDGFFIACLERRS